MPKEFHIAVEAYEGRGCSASVIFILEIKLGGVEYTHMYASET
jgi:hypothetical protein